MRNGIFLVVIAFAVTLAIVVGNRLSNEAMAVVVGVVCGISATIPISVGLLIAASRHWGQSEGPREIGYDYEARRYAAQPPVVVISPPQVAQSPYTYPYYPNRTFSLPAPMNDAPLNAHQFKIVGEE